MRSIKLLVLAAATTVALALSAPSLAADAPFPMNPYPGGRGALHLQPADALRTRLQVKPAVYCADSSVFRKGNQIIFRLYITDAKTGKVMTGKDMSRVVLRIAGVKDITVGYRPQGGNANATSPWLWSTAWLVPKDYPLGTFKFDIAAKPKKTGKWVVYNPVIPGTDWQITP